MKRAGGFSPKVQNICSHGGEILKYVSLLLCVFKFSIEK